MSIKNKIIVTAVIVVSCCVTCVLGYSIYKDINDSPKVSVHANEIMVTGEYGEAIPLAGSEVSLVMDPIQVTMRKSGVSQDSSLKGRFMVKGIDSSVFASILNKDQPYILIKNDYGVYVLNLETVKDTKELYDDILKSNK